MNRLLARLLPHSRKLLSIASGLLLAAAFPKAGVAGMAWIAPGMLAASALGKRGGDSFRLGYLAGLVFHLTALYWLLLIPYRWHGIPCGPALGWVALCSFLALYPATWVWLVSQVLNHEVGAQTPRGGSGSQSRLGPGQVSVLDCLPSKWVGRTAWALLGATAWVALEILQSHILSGFPWNLLGASQYRMTPLIQISSYTGVYGVSFLAVWVALSALSAVVMILQSPQSRSIWLREIFLPILFVAVIFNFGAHRMRSAESEPRKLQVTFVQPSIPQTLIWDPANDDARFQDLLNLSVRAVDTRRGSGPGGPELLLWPEGAVPKLLRYHDEMLLPITSLARTNNLWLILGADDMEPAKIPKARSDREYFNSSFLISPDGRLRERYTKRKLVIFGEYVPMRHWLPFLKYFTPMQDDDDGYTSGTEATQFKLGELKTQTSVLICFEDVFPDLARESTQEDTDFLVNITNDGWFGQSSEQWQHAANAVFRAVENGVPLLRCANNGLTCWVDEHGSIRDMLADSDGGIYGEGFIAAEIPLPAEGAHHGSTFYHEHGDWFGWVCVAATGAITVIRLFPLRQKWQRDKTEI